MAINSKMDIEKFNGKFLAVEAQDGRSVGGQRSMDHGISRYYTYMKFNK
jgi:hypothetical protein